MPNELVRINENAFVFAIEYILTLGAINTPKSIYSSPSEFLIHLALP